MAPGGLSIGTLKRNNIPWFIVNPFIGFQYFAWCFQGRNVSTRLIGTARCFKGLMRYRRKIIWRVVRGIGFRSDRQEV
jgi:hypothetical protein